MQNTNNTNNNTKIEDLKIGERKKALGILAASHFMSDVYGGFIIPIMPIIAANLGISLGIVGFLHTISSISSSVLQPFFGFLSDIVKRRFFIFWGLILASIFISTIGHVNNIWTLGIIIFLGSLGIGFYHPQATALAGYYSGNKINSMMGLFIACGTMGFAFGPFLSSSIVETFGLNSTIYAAIPGLITAILLYKILPKIKHQTSAPKIKEVSGVMWNLRKIISLLAVTSIIRALAVQSFCVLMPFLWKEYNLSLTVTGMVIALFSFTGGACSYFGGVLSNKFGRKALMIASFIPTVPCLLGSLYLLKSLPLVAILLFIMAGALLYLSTSVNIVLAQRAAPENMGIVSGIIGGFSWGAAGILLTPIGVMASMFGIIPVLSLVAITPLAGIVASIMIPEKYS